MGRGDLIGNGDRHLVPAMGFRGTPGPDRQGGAGERACRHLVRSERRNQGAGDDAVHGAAVEGEGVDSFDDQDQAESRPQITRCK
jgi:hypothetical protein